MQPRVFSRLATYQSPLHQPHMCEAENLSQSRLGLPAPVQPGPTIRCQFGNTKRKAACGIGIDYRAARPRDNQTRCHTRNRIFRGRLSTRPLIGARSAFVQARTLERATQRGCVDLKIVEPTSRFDLGLRFRRAVCRGHGVIRKTWFTCPPQPAWRFSPSTLVGASSPRVVAAAVEPPRPSRGPFCGRAGPRVCHRGVV